ncbi:PA14 domain-containing protein [Salmonirosea aquatica]|uniref:PA14 domain-containing protein n=1 Tax=Salmonirosea aquatica TaxID=2654236 RepID=UPI00128AE7A2
MTAVLTSFEAPSGVADNYGARISGYVVPPVGGSYTFWVTADDAAILWLSTDESPSHKDTIAYKSTYTNSRNYTASATQKSAPITLECGKRYYIEALVKDSIAGDHLSVSWQIPGRLWDRLPIAGQYLAPAPTCAFAIRAGDAPGVLADTGRVYQNAPLRLAVEKPAGWTDTFTWTAARNHFVSGPTATDSTATRSSTDSVYVRPTSPGVYTYKVTSTTRATCFREFRLTVEDAACECTDCDLPQWQSEKVVADADIDLSSYPFAAVVENTYLAPTATLTGTTEISQTVTTSTASDGRGRWCRRASAPRGRTPCSPWPTTGWAAPRRATCPTWAARAGHSRPTLRGTGQLLRRFEGDGNAYSISVLEQSPLQRLEQQGSVGGAWQPVAGNQNKIGSDKATYRHNTSADDVVEITWTTPRSMAGGPYAASRLFVTEYKDAQNNRAEEFRDIYGRTVCTRVHNGTQTLTTYHAHDDFDRPRLMFPPNASVALEGWPPAPTTSRPSPRSKDQVFCTSTTRGAGPWRPRRPTPRWRRPSTTPRPAGALPQRPTPRRRAVDLHQYDELGRVHSRGVLASTADRATQQAAVEAVFTGTLATAMRPSPRWHHRTDPQLLRTTPSRPTPARPSPPNSAWTPSGDGCGDRAR